MARRNYFELLGLDFDPPEGNKRRIEKAIETWEITLSSQLGSETDSVRRGKLKEELDLKGDMSAVMGDPKRRKMEADELKTLRMRQLEKLIDVMRFEQMGTPVVSFGMIRNVQQKLKLAQKTVEDTYIKKGFVVQKRPVSSAVKDAFLLKTVAGTLHTKLAQLRTMTIPEYPWTPNVNDLFDFACYYSGGKTSDAPTYRKKSAAELRSIMETGGTKYAGDMSAQGHLLADLFTAGATQVFIDESTKKKYERTLARDKLGPFFALLKTAPEDFKRDRFFADSCIKTIQKSFPDFDLALALYNEESGLGQNPYEPIEALIHVTCGACGAAMEFRTREEAEKARCATCGAMMYVKCPSCTHMAPASAERCSCGFRISEMKFFDGYLRDADTALAVMDIAEARRLQKLAENAHPGHPKLADLKNRVKKASDEYDIPLKELEALTGSGRYTAAQQKLAQFAISMPKLKLDSQQKLISQKMLEAHRMMPAASLPARDRANRCVEILNTVSDYQPALDVLKENPPEAPVNLSGTIKGDSSMRCDLVWASGGDKGVFYRVVRKKNGVPNAPVDGDVLETRLSIMEYHDENVEPGVSYGYAVFAVRAGVFSKRPATCVVEHLSELDSRQLISSAENGVCRFSWVPPANCIGVRILRSEDGIAGTAPNAKTMVVAPRASGRFEDRNVKNDTSYWYRLQCIYPYGQSFRYTEGTVKLLKPECPPIKLNDVRAKSAGNVVTVSWIPQETVQRSVEVRTVQSDSAMNQVGQLLPVAEINRILGRGIVYARANSDIRQCQFSIPANTAIQFAVVVIGGDRGIISSILRVSSVEKCELERMKTRVEGDYLRIFLKIIPRNLSKIHYVVAKRTGAVVPWATVEQAKANQLSTVTAAQYEQNGMIPIKSPEKADLYITVIGEYQMPDGTIVYSDPSTLKINNREKHEVRYWLEWRRKGLRGLVAKDCVLHIRTFAEETPLMKLVYRTDGHIPKQINEPGTCILFTVQETDKGFHNGEYSYLFPDSTWERISANTQLRLMIPKEEEALYELRPEKLDALKVPKKP